MWIHLFKYLYSIKYPVVYVRGDVMLDNRKLINNLMHIIFICN